VSAVNEAVNEAGVFILLVSLKETLFILLTGLIIVMVSSSLGGVASN
jgi:hypothetical protein